MVNNHGEFGRQDESYYIVIAGQGAKTYLGFNEPDSCEKFFWEVHLILHQNPLLVQQEKSLPYKNHLHTLSFTFRSRF